MDEWGANDQIDMCIEECAELIQALNKAKRKGLNDHDAQRHVCEELADVGIMCDQMRYIFEDKRTWSHTVSCWKEYKLNRLSHRLTGEDYTAPEPERATDRMWARRRQRV